MTRLALALALALLSPLALASTAAAATTYTDSVRGVEIFPGVVISTAVAQPCPATATFPFALVSPAGLVPGAIVTTETGTFPVCSGTFVVFVGAVPVPVGAGTLTAVHEEDEVSAQFSGALTPLVIPGVGPIGGTFSGTLEFEGTPLSGKGEVTTTFCVLTACQTVNAEFVAAGGVFSLTEVELED